MGAPAPQPYATPTDLANVGLGAQALSVISVPEQEAALLAASQEADGALNSQFVLPLIDWGSDLTTHVCELAAYYLLSQRGFNPEVGPNINVRKRFEDAKKWLADVAANKYKPVVIDSSVITSPGGQPDGQAGRTGFALSVGAPINRAGFVPGGGRLNFWNNSVAATFAARGGEGAPVAFSGPSLQKMVTFVRSVPAVRVPLNQALAGTALREVQMGFRNEENPYGAEWRELSESTVKGRRKGKRKRGPKILQDTGRLRNSFSAPYSEGGFKVGTNVEYAVYHQQPDGPGKGIIPQRMMLPMAGQMGNWRQPMLEAAKGVLERWADRAQ